MEFILQTLQKMALLSQAGIKKGDIIRKINDVSINSGSELQEQLSNYKPGDKVNVTYDRNGTQNTVAGYIKK